MAISGQVTVTTAGTAVQMTTVDGSLFLLSADPDNTGTVWFGNDGAGDVTENNGFPLRATGPAIPMSIANLDMLYVDAENDGDKICWTRLAS